MPFAWIHNALRLAACLGSSLLSVWGFLAVRNRRSVVRTPTRVAAVMVFTVSSLLFCLLLLGIFSMVSHSAMAFAPDGRHAARVENIDGGATGGDTSVVVYSNLGLTRDFVLSGGWGIVKEENLHWAGNGDLQIDYDGRWGDSPKCKSTSSVKVRCVQAPIVGAATMR